MMLACTGCSGRAGSNATATQTAAEETPRLTVEANADSLYSFVERQVELGPRTPGTYAHTACGKEIEKMLIGYGVDSIVHQHAPVTTFDGKRFEAWNILGRINPESERRVLLVAHYDTRPWADNEPDASLRDKPVMGANDGASGVAVLLETARLLGRQAPDSLGIDLLFVDMEDSGEDGGPEETWCLGTQEWVKSMPYTAANKPKYGILLDMVGGIDAKFYREYFSEQGAPQYVDRIWAVARPHRVVQPHVAHHLRQSCGHRPHYPQGRGADGAQHNSSINSKLSGDKTMTINEKQDEIIAEMSELDDWMDRYAYIIDLGNSLPPIAEEYKTPEYLIEGCQSRVWIHAELTPEGKVVFTADSDAIIVKGIISMLIEVLSGHTPQEILDADLYFIDRIGLSEHLSPTRSNGLLAMVKQIKMYALAYKELESAS